MRKYSEACEQNKGPILEILTQVFKNRNSVLEIGSGTGQHAIYFAKHLRHLQWQPSDLAANLCSIRSWIAEEDIPNLKAPVDLDVSHHPWPVDVFDAVFSANTLHIMSWEMVEHFFSGVGKVLGSEGVLLVYGPFSYQGKHTSPSNASFDQFLRQRDPKSGVRDLVEVGRLAALHGLDLVEDYSMPVNNRCVVWRKCQAIEGH